MIERFMAKVDQAEDGCWNWTGYLTPDGYGRFQVGKSSRVASRVGYELLVGPIPEGLTIDHLCRNRRCVNPEHLEPVTHRQNVDRGQPGSYQRSKTHCPQDHPYSGENLYISPSGRRHCRICARLAQRRYRLRKLRSL